MTVNCGYKMDKKIASGLELFFSFSWLFLIPSASLRFVNETGVNLQLCQFHITNNYGCLHGARGGGSFHSFPPFLVNFIERKGGMQTRQLLLEKTFQLFCKGGHISYGLRELWNSIVLTHLFPLSTSLLLLSFYQCQKTISSTCSLFDFLLHQ